MGCDIHMVVEQRVAHGEWITVNTMKAHDGQNGFSYPTAIERNYERFAALACVRGDGPEPNGIPDDISETGEFLIRCWDGDGHSHGHLNLKDASELFKRTDHSAFEADSFAAKYPAYRYFGIEGNLDEHRIVFWFDN